MKQNEVKKDLEKQMLIKKIKYLQGVIYNYNMFPNYHNDEYDKIKAEIELENCNIEYCKLLE